MRSRGRALGFAAGASDVEACLFECRRDSGLLGDRPVVCTAVGSIIGRCSSLWFARQPSSHVVDAPARYAAYKFDVPAYVAPVTMASKMPV